MDFNINSPAYFTQQYGVDDDIYKLCRTISSHVKHIKYSEIYDIIGLVPIVEPLDQKRKEAVEYKTKMKLIYITTHIDYELYVNGDMDTRKNLMIKCILDSIKKISKKAKIDYVKFEEDILGFLGNEKLKTERMGNSVKDQN